MKNRIYVIACLFAVFSASCVKSFTDDLQPGTGDGSVAKAGEGETLKQKLHSRSMATTDPLTGAKAPQHEVDCRDAVCTMVFVELMLKVTDAQGNPLQLDSYHTEDMAGNLLPSHMFGYSDYHQSYVVLNDAWVRQHQNTTLQVRFVGRKGSKTVDQVFTIATDCCHVSKAAGQDVLVL